MPSDKKLVRVFYDEVVPYEASVLRVVGNVKQARRQEFLRQVMRLGLRQIDVRNYG